MNGQVKYILTAFLLLLLVVTGYNFVTTFFEQSVTDSEEPWCATVSTPLPTPDSESGIKGKSLFQQNCASCHNIYKDATGPSLLGFTERGPWTVRQNVYDWIRNPTAFMQKNEYARKLKEIYGSMMTAFPHLTNEEINAICDFVDFEAERRMAPIVSK